MAEARTPYTDILRELAGLMVAVAGESVTLIKRSAPESSLKLKPASEWKIYLEFLKVMFNLADRLSALYVPLKDQPLFMDSLEDAVTDRLKTVLTPALGPDSDEMEVVLTIGGAVSESRQLYEPFRFVVTEDGKEKEALFRLLGQRVATLLNVPEDEQVVATATLCASAVIAAMKSALEGFAAQSGVVPGDQGAGASSPDVGGRPDETAKPAAAASGNEIKLVSVISTVQGEEVETRWGLHPRFRDDLRPHERQELTRLMNRVNRIIGERYAAVAFSPNWTTWHRIGHA